MEDETETTRAKSQQSETQNAPSLVQPWRELVDALAQPWREAGVGQYFEQLQHTMSHVLSESLRGALVQTNEATVVAFKKNIEALTQFSGQLARLVAEQLRQAAAKAEQRRPTSGSGTDP